MNGTGSIKAKKSVDKSPVKKAKAAKPKVGMTFVATVLDRSGSMSHLRMEVVDMVNMIHNGLKRSAKRFKTPLSLSMYLFDDHFDTVFENTDIKEVEEYSGYGARGSTRLFGAIENTIDRLLAFGHLVKEKAYLVNIVTDGQDNMTLNIPRIVERIKILTEEGNWTFTFQLPVGQADWFAAKYNIPRGNVTEWEQTTQGTLDVANSTDLGTSQYLQSRTQGRTQSKNFYSDASKLTTSKVSKVLDGVTSDFRVLKVTSESVIKDFVEQKTKKPYVIGSAYYQLMKDELVQGTKDILLMKKGTKVVNGGPEARALIGIPVGGSVKVKPGNHGDWDIFVLSTSVNRKLPRGTVVLVNKTKVTNSKPTWDHNAAAAGV